MKLLEHLPQLNQFRRQKRIFSHLFITHFEIGIECVDYLMGHGCEMRRGNCLFALSKMNFNCF
uniref:Uncharacterized protein n=1 Tax=Lutzomyia longipalpis TaxID=7200 RepID=A0A1B0CQX6_LUTLO